MAIVTGCRGLCLKYDGELHLIHGIGGNPFIYVDSARNIEVPVVGEMLELLDRIVKIMGGYYDPDRKVWVTV